MVFAARRVAKGAEKRVGWEEARRRRLEGGERPEGFGLLMLSKWLHCRGLSSHVCKMGIIIPTEMNTKHLAPSRYLGGRALSASIFLPTHWTSLPGLQPVASSPGQVSFHFKGNVIIK